MLKKIFNETRTKVVLMTICMVFMFTGLVFATSVEGAESSAREIFDIVWGFVCAIPGLLAVMSGIQAGISYSQAHSDGGNAVAAGKFSSQIVSCLLCVVVTIICATKLKEIVKGLLSL